MDSLEWKGNLAYLGKRKLGFIKKMDGVLVFTTPRHRAEHFFRMFRGWGVNKQLVISLQSMAIEEIWIQVKDEGILKSSLKTWLKWGKPYQHKDFEEQLILNESFFGPGQTKLGPVQTKLT